jgi:hypothetical protein
MVVVGRSMEGPTPPIFGKLREGVRRYLDLFYYEMLKRRAVGRKLVKR